jgi:hypothetical protein
MNKQEFEIPDYINELSEELHGGYWNTRIIKKTIEGDYKDGTHYKEIVMDVYEIYYKQDGTIWAWSENPICTAFSDREEFGDVLKHFVEASQKTILELVNDELVDTYQTIEFYEEDEEDEEDEQNI